MTGQTRIDGQTERTTAPLPMQGASIQDRVAAVRARALGAPDAPVESVDAEGRRAPVLVPARVHVAPPAGDAGAAVAEAIRALVASTPAGLDEESVRALVHAEVKALAPRRIEVCAPGRAPVAITGHTHPIFAEVLKVVSVGIPCLLIGPAGTGKTHLARQVADALALEWRGVVSFSAATAESALLGRLTPAPDGSLAYRSTPFVDAFENGGVVCLDEMDAADPNALVCLNAALANGETTLPARVENPRVERHPDFRVVGCANTFGTGPSRQYAGRGALDAATMDRFRMGRVAMDYDASFERCLIGDGSDAVKLHARWIDLRRRAKEGALPVVVSTRALLDGCKLLSAGFSVDECVQKLAMDWSADVRTRMGVA